MTWVKMDDCFRDHPRFVDASSGLVGVYLSGLAYSNRYCLDGHIPATALSKIAPAETPKQRERIIAELLQRGLWEIHPGGGYVVHDYLQWNDSREVVMKRRDVARQAAAARWGPHAKGNADRIPKSTAIGNADSNASRNAFGNASPIRSGSDPNPIQTTPDPIRSGAPARAREPDDSSNHFPEKSQNQTQNRTQTSAPAAQEVLAAIANVGRPLLRKSSPPPPPTDENPNAASNKSSPPDPAKRAADEAWFDSQLAAELAATQPDAPDSEPSRVVEVASLSTDSKAANGGKS